MKKYLLAYGFVIALIIALLGLNALYLSNIGEGDAAKVMQTAVARKDETCLVGSALRNGWAYKKAGYEAVKPDIVAIGSSRALQFRERFFTKSFFNVGASESRSVPALRDIINRLLEIHEPKVVLITLDFFWFHAGYDQYQTPLMMQESTGLDFNTGLLRTLAKPFIWLAQGKITLGDYISGLTTSYKTATPCRIGQQGLKLGKGMGPDGSFYNPALASGMEKAEDLRFKKIKASIEMGASGGRFGYGAALDPETLDIFRATIKKLRDRGITVILIAPPVAPAIRDALKERAGDYTYLTQLKKFFAEEGVFDFYDPALLKSDDCEFFDGYHGGDLTYARMLRAVTDSKRGAALRPYVDRNELRAVTTRYSGLSLLPDNPGIAPFAEVDFLGIGCKKTRD